MCFSYMLSKFLGSRRRDRRQGHNKYSRSQNPQPECLPRRQSAISRRSASVPRREPRQHTRLRRQVPAGGPLDTDI